MTRDRTRDGDPTVCLVPQSKGNGNEMLWIDLQTSKRLTLEQSG